MSDNRLGNIGSILSGSSPRARLFDPADIDSPGEPAPETPLVDAGTRPEPVTETTRPLSRGAQAAATLSAPVQAQPKPSRRPGGASAATTRRIALKLEQHLRDRLVERSSRDVPLAAVVLRMVADAHDRNELAALVQAEQERLRTGGGLFAGTATTVTGRAAALVELRMSGQDAKTLDGLARSAGAKDRTQFLTAVVRAALGQ